MKVLYGVQATGNGHITRARVMAPALKNAGIDCDFVFSGRPADQLFDMEVFGDYRVFPGMSFTTENGQVQFRKTLVNGLAALPRFFRDVKSLDVSNYDLILVDFEPVTAWAAKLAKMPTVGIAHQYAFRHKVPVQGDNFSNRVVMKAFSPVTEFVGLHWHHFNQPILPPLIEPTLFEPSITKNIFVVYLPFDDEMHIVKQLKKVEAQFIMYTAIKEEKVEANVTFKPFDRMGFQYDLAHCDGVITNAGFGLGSECIQYGKKILSKPLKGQMEQLSNAVALEELGIGTITNEITPAIIRYWKTKQNPEPYAFPDVAASIVDWLQNKESISLDEVSERLWSNKSDKDGFSLHDIIVSRYVKPVAGRTPSRSPLTIASSSN